MEKRKKKKNDVQNSLIQMDHRHCIVEHHGIQDEVARARVCVCVCVFVQYLHGSTTSNSCNSLRQEEGWIKGRWVGRLRSTSEFSVLMSMGGLEEGFNSPSVVGSHTQS